MGAYNHIVLYDRRNADDVPTVGAVLDKGPDFDLSILVSFDHVLESLGGSISILGVYEVHEIRAEGLFDRLAGRRVIDLPNAGVQIDGDDHISYVLHELPPFPFGLR